jgi:hypothetical protein
MVRFLSVLGNDKTVCQDIYSHREHTVRYIGKHSMAVPVGRLPVVALGLGRHRDLPLQENPHLGVFRI